MSMKWSIIVTVIATNTLLVAAWSIVYAQSYDFPAGFTYTQIADDFTLPVDIEFLPSGDILLVEKGTGLNEASFANIYLLRQGASHPTLLTQLSVNSSGDSGIQGIILDPHFEHNQYLYVWYATGQNVLDWTGETMYRLSRFTLDLQNDVIDLTSENVLFEMPWHSLHGGGGMVFDDKGRLYLAIGDLYSPETVQDLSTLNGKLLRLQITDDGYTIPPDNPFVGVSGAREEIYAYGLRNPFRMTRRLSDGAIFVADVGENIWEEINELKPGANYGWPIREGPCARGLRQPCDPAPDTMTDPILAYLHTPQPNDSPIPQGGAVTTLAVYEGDRFPDNYHDKLFFADFNQGFTAVMTPGITSTFTLTTFATETNFLVDMAYFDDKLYLLAATTSIDTIYPQDTAETTEIFAQQVTAQQSYGAIIEVQYEGPENQRPIARLSADTPIGPAPLTINFSASASESQTGDLLHYRWNFGDRSDLITTTTDSIAHQYLTDGDYEASLVVIDALNRESDRATVRITVYSGEIVQLELINLTDSTRQQYHGGDQIQYRAVRSAGLSGLDTEQPYTWRVDMHHNQHAHVMFQAYATEGDIFTIPTDNHNDSWNLWHRFYLTMHTDTGQQIQVQREIYPAHVTMTIDTNPPQLNLMVNDVQRQAPFDFTAIVGTRHTVRAFESAGYGGEFYRFEGWSGTTMLSNNASYSYTIPVSDTTYTAVYASQGPAMFLQLPIVIK